MLSHPSCPPPPTGLHFLWLKNAFISQRASVGHEEPGDPGADPIPAQIKALVVPVGLGGPSWGTSWGEVFWNATEELEAPHCSRLGPEPRA